VGSILRITLDRPEVRNALSEELVRELRAAFEAAAHEPRARVVVLSGEGRDFCAGADLNAMRSAGMASEAENRADAEALALAFRAIHACPKPVVCRAHGNVFGGGLGLLAASDVAIVARGATFAFSEVRLGILPAVISPYVVRRLGPSRARALFLTGERFDAARALDMGLCERVVELDALDGAVDAVVKELLLGSPEAQRRIKLLMEAVAPFDLEAAMQRTPAFIAEARASAEGQEGLRAFLESRPPPWVGER
jgi:methylglutaconyl-CoA hydratase